MAANDAKAAETAEEVRLASTAAASAAAAAPELEAEVMSGEQVR